MSKYFLFFDESGTSSLKSIDPSFPVLALTGLLISEPNYIALQADIVRLKSRYFPGKHVVLHRRDMRKYERGFEIFFDDNVKRRFYNDLNKILADANYMLVSSAIDKQGHIEQYGKLADDPYEIALTFVMERVVFEADAKSITEIEVHIESRGKKEDRIVSSRYNQILYRGSYNVSVDRFQRIFSQEIQQQKKADGEIGIEIADLCAYPIARHVLNNNEPNPAFDVIKPKIRSSSRGEVTGYGIKIFPGR